MVTLQEYLKESLHNHVDYNFIDYNRFYYMFEKNGIPDEVRDLTNIIDIKYDNLGYNESIDINYNKTIKIVTINKIFGEPIAEYDIENTNYVNGHVFINIYDNDDSKLNTIRNFIRHELVHAYEDLKRYEHGKELFSNIINDQYKNSAIIVANNSPKIQYNKIADILYFLHDEERNAYFSNLETDIIDAINHYNMNDTNFDYNKLIEYVKDKPLWKKYFDCGETILEIHSANVKDWYVDMMLKAYNKISNKKATISQMKKDLKTKWIKFKNKFEQLVPKIIYDNLPIKKRTISL